MPRNSNAKGTDCSANVATKVQNNGIKTEVEGPGEQHVFHRKSERRRVARDIFLVFEEQPSRRVRGSNKKKSAQKSKFSHLMVDDPHKTKGLLRDIKNEPKCYLTAAATINTNTNTTNATIVAGAAAVTECPVKEKKPPKPAVRNEVKPIEPKVVAASEDPVARVNPIFLWVKQDDTRIVEVRCEDYDKRNRIRLTKTTNGWRAIPRTDPSSSKIVKILQTPLMKVKREAYENNNAEKCNESFCSNKEVTEAIDNTSSFNNQSTIGIGQSDEKEKQKIPEVIPKEKPKKSKTKKEKTKVRKLSINYSTEEIGEQNIEVSTELSTAANDCINDHCVAIKELMLEPPDLIPAVDNTYNEFLNKNFESNSVELAERAEVTEVEEISPEPPQQLQSVALELEHEPELEAEADTETDPQSEPETATITEIEAELEAEAEAEAEEETEVEIETYQHHTPHLQLCPKTGLFIPNIGEENIDAFSTNFLSKNILVDLVDCEEVCDKSNSDQENEQIVENLDADTKNLKDLLDDADLLQHCGDNANSGADIIDSIVKRSCENNLIQETETLKEAITPATFNSSHREDILQKTVMEQAIPHILDRVSDSPKCLSFNEAGEIEGINGELFQSNNFMDTYEKESIEDISLGGKKADTPDLIAMPSPLLKNNLTDDVLEDSPKDLSYKKREEVCPPPESRSQCAVTSSSDVVKSPRPGEIPAIETTSEAIKSLILEQFIKLNALNAISSPVLKPQQSEPINLGKQRDIPTGNDCNNYAPSTNYIETVVIDDNSDEEPVKKRVRNTVKHSNAVEENTTPILIDKDPDPLTQLQLLIRNTQWKVPDPILVPKDRLRAVLASPAREIPLLITTRPELRLPEAFAYPEIIQNPNILVISMAQLEAILKNEMEMEKNKTQCPATVTPETPIEILKKPNPPCNNNKVHSEPKHTKVKDVNPKCSHVETNLASDINAATLAVLNQMLWLPYFGQLSQEFLKTIKGPPVGIQNKYSNLLPIYNHHIGLQHLDELYKNYLKQISALKHINAEPTTNPLQDFSLPIGAFQTSMEATVFQKMLQHQMHNFLNMNSLASADTAQRGMLEKSPASEATSNGEHMITMEEKKTKSATITIPEINGNGNDLSEKSHRLNHTEMSCDNAMSENADFNKYTCLQKQEMENKPRLQCKSLSNLLEPESVASPTVPLINLTSESVRSAANDQPASNQINSISKDAAVLPTAEVMPFKTGKLNKTTTGIITPHELSKQRKRSLNYTETAVAAAAVAAVEQTSRSADNLNMESNQSLWHPLFGSNAKPGYSSPWQWTTVTATGE